MAEPSAAMEVFPEKVELTILGDDDIEVTAPPLSSVESEELL